MKPLFTILTSAYNNERYLNDWCKSIVDQIYRPIEVIFVNDASNDDTSLKIQNISDRINSSGIAFKYINNDKRQHCGSAYKTAFEQSTGMYLGIVDGDDALVPDAVEFIVNQYQNNTNIGWIYTQFALCNKRLTQMKNGFCKAPPQNQSLLDIGLKGIHGYSHWRTFSRRVPKLGKIFGAGLKCAVDKYMGYRLEERSPGMFIDRVCYLYRQGSFRCISKTEKTKITWRKVMAEASARRKQYNLKPYPIMVGNA